MNQYISVLKRSKLFAGVDESNVPAMLNCLQANFKSYKKGEYIFREGDCIHELVILLEGTLHIQKDDYWGNRSIVNIVSSGEMFGEAYIAPDSGTILNDVVTTEDSTVVFLNIGKILTVCPSACHFHSLVIQNLFFTISAKNRSLVQKLGHITKRTTREKLISYLSDEAKRQGSTSFKIPFNRQELADFLSVDRSAMSNELCKLRDEGLITFNRSNFKLFLY